MCGTYEPTSAAYLMLFASARGTGVGVGDAPAFPSEERPARPALEVLEGICWLRKGGDGGSHMRATMMNVAAPRAEAMILCGRRGFLGSDFGAEPSLLFRSVETPEEGKVGRTARYRV